MAAYIARRLLLMIPTLFGIMLISVVVGQFAPGGPVERIAWASGAAISARNLFENVPARRKFLRQPQTEASYVTPVVSAYALAYPGVAFPPAIDARRTMTTHRRGEQNPDAVGGGAEAPCRGGRPDGPGFRHLGCRSTTIGLRARKPGPGPCACVRKRLQT